MSLKKTVFAPLIALLLKASAGYAEPVLLATVSNQFVPYGDALVASWEMNDVLSLTVLTNGHLQEVRLFQHKGVIVEANGPPQTLHQSFDSRNTPDFDLVTSYLTDGVSLQVSPFQSFRLLGLWGHEDILNVLVPRFSEYDLYGYTIERIDRNLTFAMVSPGRDLNGDGQWTDFYVGGTYEFWGSPVPEPATLMLLAIGAATVLSSRRVRQV